MIPLEGEDPEVVTSKFSTWFFFLFSSGTSNWSSTNRSGCVHFLAECGDVA